MVVVIPALFDGTELRNMAHGLGVLFDGSWPVALGGKDRLYSVTHPCMAGGKGTVGGGVVTVWVLELLLVPGLWGNKGLDMMPILAPGGVIDPAY